MEKIQSIKMIKINDTWIMTFIVLMNIILKSIYLTDYNIDLDEPFTLYYSQQSLKELWSMLNWENNPPLYFFVLHFWIKLFGVGILSARILPMLFGALAAGLVYRLGARFLSKIIGLVVALIFTFSNIMIKEAHDCRVYTLFTLLTIASMYFYMSLIKERCNRKYLIALTILNILLVYSHFLAFLVIGLQCFYLLVIPIIRKRIFKQYIISIVLTILAYMPYAAIFIFRFFETSNIGINQPPLAAARVYATFFETFGNGFLTTNIFILITIIFLIYILIKRKKFSIYEIIVSGWFFMLYLFSFIVSLKFPILTTPRYLIFIVPGFFFFIVIAVNHLFEKDKLYNNLAHTFVVLMMLSAMNLNYSNKMEAKKTVNQIKQMKSNSTIVYIVPSWVAYLYAYHYDSEIFTDYKNFEERLQNDNIYLLDSVGAINTEKLREASNIIIFEGWNNMSYVDPGFKIISTLEYEFGEIDNIIRNWGYTVYHFSNQNKPSN